MHIFFERRIIKYPPHNYVTAKHSFVFIWELCCFTTLTSIRLDIDKTFTTHLRKYLVSAVDNKVFIWRTYYRGLLQQKNVQLGVRPSYEQHLV